MKPWTYNLICRLSLEFENPAKVKRLIKSYIDSNVTHLKATVVRNTLEIFVKNAVALNDVHNSAKALTSKIRNPKARLKNRLEFERKVMFSKLLDARRHQQSSEKQLKSDKLKMSDSVIPYQT